MHNVQLSAASSTSADTDRPVVQRICKAASAKLERVSAAGSDDRYSAEFRPRAHWFGRILANRCVHRSHRARARRLREAEALK